MKRLQLASVAVSRPEDSLVVLADHESLDQLTPLLAAAEFEYVRQSVQREVNTFVFLRHPAPLFIRLLKPEANPVLALEDARLAGNELLNDLCQYKVETVVLRNTCRDNRALAFAEGMALGSYQFLKYFTQPDKKQKSPRRIEIEANTASPAAVQELDALIDTVFLARDLVNEPQSHLDAQQFAEEIRQAGERYGFSVEVLGKEKIESLKMGGLLAVNRGSDAPPCFCVLEWQPDHVVDEQPTVLVGKGVVYDTGGLSLKPSDGMEYMKSDMAGAAAVVATLAAAARNRLPVHLIGLLPITDNRISARAVAPGDVIRMYSGKTVEVLNTDAEGRLILADALHYAKKFNPRLVVDLATLTGAAVRALGIQAICYMGNAPDDVKNSLEHSGWATYERLIELPLWREYGDELKSNIADLKNIGQGNAGMITAGKFLENFVDYPWLHLDIAGPAYLRTANGYRTKEGTGVGVRLLYDFLKKTAL